MAADTTTPGRGIRSRLSSGKVAGRAARGLFLTGLLVVVGGCEAFRVGNPFLPRTRLLAQVDDDLTTVKLSPGKNSGFDVKVNPEILRVTVKPFPGDITPGVRLTAYSIDWFDINGATISANILPTRTQGITVYLGKGSGSGGGGGGAATEKQFQIPVITKSIEAYGITNGFVTDARGVSLPRVDGWSQFLTGRITFSGRDDNGYPVNDVSANFTVKFDPSASASAGI